MPDPRMTTTTRMVLQALADNHRHGTAIRDATGLKTGTIHPILARLEAAGWVVSEWEQPDVKEPGRAARRYYQLTDTGRANVPATPTPRRPA